MVDIIFMSFSKIKLNWIRWGDFIIDKAWLAFCFDFLHSLLFWGFSLIKVYFSIMEMISEFEEKIHVWKGRSSNNDTSSTHLNNPPGKLFCYIVIICQSIWIWINMTVIFFERWKIIHIRHNVIIFKISECILDIFIWL